MNSFFEQPLFFSIFQMALDIGLIVFLMIFLAKRSRSAKAMEDFTLSLQKVIEETRTISEQFDANLEERKKIIQQFIFNLDQHLRDAEKVCKRLETTIQKEVSYVSQPTMHYATQSSLPSNDHQEIFHLAQKGFDAESIAKRLQKPVGEVELILNLNRMSSG